MAFPVGLAKSSHVGSVDTLHEISDSVEEA
jgi:hypothetical protein